MRLRICSDNFWSRRCCCLHLSLQCICDSFFDPCSCTSSSSHCTLFMDSTCWLRSSRCYPTFYAYSRLLQACRLLFFLKISNIDSFSGGPGLSVWRKDPTILSSLLLLTFHSKSSYFHTSWLFPLLSNFFSLFCRTCCRLLDCNVCLLLLPKGRHWILCSFVTSIPRRRSTFSFEHPVVGKVTFIPLFKEKIST